MRANDPENAPEQAPSLQRSDLEDVMALLAQAYRSGDRSISASELREKVLHGVAFWADLALDEAAQLVDRFDALAADRSLIKTVAVQELIDRLCALTLRDGLTGLFNRRYLDYCLEHEIQRVEREFAPCSVVFLDVDHFKHVNDQFGHDRGDQVLRGVAELMLRTLRQTDISARIGGEEFVAVLPGTGVGEAARAAKRLCETVASASFGSGRDTIRVTVSCGVSTYFPRTRLDARELLKRADDALYRAKQLGRNRVELYRPAADERPQGVSAAEKDGLVG
jgi:diguanylate cyclase (GGDEF)-like protein